MDHANAWCALAAAQAEFSSPKKDSTNPAFRSKYADLANVVEAVAPALSRHGLAFLHYVDARDIGAGSEQCMVTALVHGKSNTRIECPVPLILGKRDMQGFKSATTYAKRIGLESVTGVAPDDDDGNAAAANPPARDTRPAQEPAFNTQEAAKRIAAKLSSVRDLDELSAAWKSEQATIALIRASDPEQATHLTAIKDKRKNDLAPILEDSIPY